MKSLFNMGYGGGEEFSDKFAPPLVLFMAEENLAELPVQQVEIASAPHKWNYEYVVEPTSCVNAALETALRYTYCRWFTNVVPYCTIVQLYIGINARSGVVSALQAAMSVYCLACIVAVCMLHLGAFTAAQLIWKAGPASSIL